MSPVRPLARLGVRGFCNAQPARPMRVLAGCTRGGGGADLGRGADPVRDEDRSGVAFRRKTRPASGRSSDCERLPRACLRIVPSRLAMPAPSARLSGKRLYIADLAARLEAMEDGGAPMNAIAYRLYARRMAAAMEGYPPGLLAAQLGRAYPSVLDAIEGRQFEADGVFGGPHGRSARVVATALLRHFERQRRTAR